MKKLIWLLFCAILEKIRQLFNSSSGHTDSNGLKAFLSRTVINRSYHVLLFFDRVCLRKDNCSVTRLDVFYCSSQQNFEKVAQLIGFFFCYFEKSHFYTKTALGTFRATFGYNWATFHSNIWSHWTPAAFPNTWLWLFTFILYRAGSWLHSTGFATKWPSLWGDWIILPPHTYAC